MVFHGNGGFIFSEVWDMPVWQRKYHIKLINDHIERVNGENEPQQQSEQTNHQSPLGPAINPKGKTSYK